MICFGQFIELRAEGQSVRFQALNLAKRRCKSSSQELKQRRRILIIVCQLNQRLQVPQAEGSALSRLMVWVTTG